MGVLDLLLGFRVRVKDIFFLERYDDPTRIIS
jgi:hypothetical protein